MRFRGPRRYKDSRNPTRVDVRETDLVGDTRRVGPTVPSRVRREGETRRHFEKD